MATWPDMADKIRLQHSQVSYSSLFGTVHIHRRGLKMVRGKWLQLISGLQAGLVGDTGTTLIPMKESTEVIDTLVLLARRTFLHTVVQREASLD
jgi:hypothetical protein